MEENDILNLADEIAEEIFKSFSQRFNPKLRYIENSMKQQKDLINRILNQQKVIIDRLVNLEKKFRGHTINSDIPDDYNDD